MPDHTFLNIYAENWWGHLNAPAFAEWMLVLALASPALLIVAILGIWAFVHRHEGDMQIVSETDTPPA